MSDTIKKLREALTRISELTPSAANAATARDLHLTVRAIADTALTDAPPSGDQGSVKVKALEWYTPVTSTTLSRADTDFGVYRVWANPEPDGRWFWNLDGPANTDGEAPYETSAKAAAQADYEKRILSAIEQVDLPVAAEGWVMVPREPTEAMLATQGKSRPDLAKSARAKRMAELLNEEMRRIASEIWSEMLAVSPPPGAA